MPVVLARKALPKPNPKSDPRFRRIEEQLKQGAARVKAHPPASKKAADAAKAAKGPPNERVAGGKAKQVDKIKDAREGKPEQSSFLAVLRAEIAKVMPQTLGQTENFDQTAQQMKGGLKGNVAQQKENSTKDVSGASKQAPVPAGEAKAGQPLPKEGAPPPPKVDAAGGMPAPKSDADVSLEDSKQHADQQMKDAEITTPQMKKANDPRFTAVVEAKDKVVKNADAGPAKYRAAEKATLTSVAAGAVSSAKVTAAAMIGVRSGSNLRVLSRQQQQKAADEAKRKAVVDRIEAIYAATKAKVEARLAAIDPEVNGMFDSGVDAALNRMTTFVNAKIRAYKIDRYLSIPIVGAARWIRDQFKGLPDEVNAFYQQGRAVFQAAMDALIVRVAAVVEKRLREAKAEVARGQAQIKAFVASQPKELQQVARQAQADVAGRFAELEKGIEEKKNSLAQSLAQKYKEGFDKANEALKKIQDENKGLVQILAEKIGEIIKILREFKAKLMSILRKGADTIKLIIADPIGFVGNLIAAVKGGIQAFVANIWKHLKAGFMRWLFGNLPPGVAPPSDLSLPSILKLVLGVLGITYEKMRAKAVRLLGERAVSMIEKLVGYVQTLIGGGPAALWEQIKADIGNLKAMVIDAIQDWLITTIIKQAVTKIVSMFNPAGAIIQAIIAIYNIVMFVVEKAAQIMAFVESVINSVHAIATGAIGGAIKFIEQALGNTIPIVIGFLARLIGLGGLSKKVHEFIVKVQTKIDQAIDKLLKKIVDKVKKLFGGGKKEKKDDKAADLTGGLAALDALTVKAEKEGMPKPKLESAVAGVKSKHKVFKTLSVSDEAGAYMYAYTASPGTKKKGPKKTAGQYNVGLHVVGAPSGVAGKGESHHVPVKVLVKWFGEVLTVAGKVTKDPEVVSAANTYKNNTGGDLSAIWLTEEDHKAAHAPAVPGQIAQMKSDIQVITQEGELSAKPTRATITAAVHGQLLPGSPETDKQGRIVEIYNKKATRLASLFKSVFEALLEQGIAFVGRIKFVDANWKSKLKAKAKSSWASFLKIPKARKKT